MQTPPLVGDGTADAHDRRRGCRSRLLAGPVRRYGTQPLRTLKHLVIGILIASSGMAVAAEAQAGLERLDATRSRPLFNPLRRAPPVAAPTVVAAPTSAPTILAPPPNLQLHGVVIGPERTIAIVRRAADAKLISLEVGHDIDGWSVAAIRAREVELRLGSRVATLRLSTR